MACISFAHGGRGLISYIASYIVELVIELTKVKLEGDLWIRSLERLNTVAISKVPAQLEGLHRLAKASFILSVE